MSNTARSALLDSILVRKLNRVFVFRVIYQLDMVYLSGLLPAYI